MKHGLVGLLLEAELFLMLVRNNRKHNPIVLEGMVVVAIVGGIQLLIVGNNMRHD